MKTFAILFICFQACLVQNVFGACPLGYVKTSPYEKCPLGYTSEKDILRTTAMAPAAAITPFSACPYGYVKTSPYEKCPLGYTSEKDILRTTAMAPAAAITPFGAAIAPAARLGLSARGCPKAAELAARRAYPLAEFTGRRAAAVPIRGKCGCGRRAPIIEELMY